MTSFTPSVSGITGRGADNTNGSFQGFGADLTDNNGMGYAEITVTNDFQHLSMPTALGIQSSNVYSRPLPQNQTVAGFTPNDIQAAHHNYTVSAVVDPEDILGIQIYELGNSLSVITLGPVAPGQLRTAEDDPGRQTLDCYNKASGSNLLNP